MLTCTCTCRPRVLTCWLLHVRVPQTTRLHSTCHVILAPRTHPHPSRPAYVERVRREADDEHWSTR